MKPLLITIIIFLLGLFDAKGQKALQLYGGEDHKEYLGCLNCNRYDRNSIWNPYGNFGSKYNSNCIWNSYGNYGGKYSNQSPFNAYAMYPPVIVDEDGNFYGYLTVNEHNSKQSTIPTAVIIYKNWESIKDDVSDWYAKIFNN